MADAATAALTQVQAVSNLNVWIDIDPEATYFQQEYARPTPFAIAESDLCPQSGVAWGKCLQFEVARAGDLLGAMFLKLKRKGVRFAADHFAAIGGDSSLMFVNASGHAAIREAVLQIGQVTVDKFTGEFMELLEQHRAQVGNEQGEMIGSFENASNLRNWSFNDQVMYIALHFFHFEKPETYMPIITLSAHPVNVKVYLREKLALINAEDSATQTGIDMSVAGRFDDVFNGDLVDAALTVRMVFLDQFERNLVSAEVHEILAIEHQEDCCEVILQGTTQKSVTLSFNNALLFIMSRFRADSSVALSNHNLKDYFQYTVQRSGTDTPDPAFGGAYHVSGPLFVTPFNTWELKFNGSPRFAARDAEYFSHVVPFLHAVKKSKSRAVLLYSFHLAPFTDYQTPAGQAMASRIHEIKSCAHFRTDSSGANLITEDGEWCHFAMAYNVHRYSMGQMTKKFT